MSKRIWTGVGEPTREEGVDDEIKSLDILWDKGEVEEAPIVEKKENKITIDEYNKIIYDGAIAKDYTSNQHDVIKDKTFVLPHPDVMVRLFKANTISKSGIIMPNVKMVPSPSGEKLVPELDDNELSDFITRGVIVAVGDKCTMKDQLNIGDIVDIKPIRNLGDHQFKFHKSKDSKFENYFIFPEVYIQMIWSSKATPNS